MHCKKDGTLLTVTDSDTRQEWREVYLDCQECNTQYTRRTTYSQDGLVESDELIEEKDE
jgi:hypothetical protein